MIDNNLLAPPNFPLPFLSLSYCLLLSTPALCYEAT